MQTAVSHSPEPMPQRIGPLTNDRRWALIVDAIAELLANGDRAAKGLPVVGFTALSDEDQDRYRRYALAGTIPVAYPNFYAACQHAAMHRACEVWEGDGGHVSRAIAGRMWKAWAWGFSYFQAALDATIPDRQVVQRDRELKQLIAPSLIGKKERIQ